METRAGLAKYNIVAFVTIVHTERARSFYRDTLGLTLIREEPPFALVFDAHGILLRLAIGKEVPKNCGTVLGWRVPDIVAAVEELVRAGVEFERFEGMKQDGLGVWTSPSGARVAWFRDPDGNILGLSELPEQ